jgi:hypothetical protein
MINFKKHRGAQPPRSKQILNFISLLGWAGGARKNKKGGENGEDVGKN